MTTGFIMLTLIYVISMEFLSLSRRRSSSRNVRSGEERGDTAAFVGYDDENNNVKNNWFYEQNNCSARASRFLVQFDVHYKNTTRNLPMRRFMEDMDIQTNCPFSIWPWIKPLRIQIKEKSLTFEEFGVSKIDAIKFERTQIHFFNDVFTAAAVVVVA